MKIKKNVFCLVLLLIFANVFSSNFAQTLNLKIIETSDVHGAVLPYDLLNDTTTNSSLSQVHTFAISERYKPNQEVILLDNGDILQGDPLVYFYNYEDTVNSHAYADAMNFMTYDAATVGNHDIEAGHSVYDRFRKEISFPWLAANAINKKTNEPYFDPYTIIERNGIKIAVLGLITPYIPNWLPEVLWDGIEFWRQQRRVWKGHAPANPSNPRHLRILSESSLATTFDLLDRDPVGYPVNQEDAIDLVKGIES